MLDLIWELLNVNNGQFEFIGFPENKLEIIFDPQSSRVCTEVVFI